MPSSRVQFCDFGAETKIRVTAENMQHLVDDLTQLNITALGVFLERAKGLYEENMGAYVKTLMRRSFGRLMVSCGPHSLSGPACANDVQDFFDGVGKLLLNAPASEIHLHSSYSRSALKKMLKDNGAKDMRKAVETMSKRVDKHFADDDPASTTDASTSALIQIVWKEITSALKAETSRAQEMIAKSYGDSGMGLEYSVSDVEAVCKRQK